MRSRVMLSSLEEELFLGRRSARISFRSRLLKVSMSLLLTHRRKLSGFASSLDRSSNHSLKPTTLFCDNQSAIALTRDHQYHARTKHIDIRFHFLRWISEKGAVRLIYCPTNDMVADTLYPHQSVTLTKGQALRCRTRPPQGLRGSVGIMANSC